MDWKLQIHTLDVGQGDSSIICVQRIDDEGALAEQKTILIDGGDDGMEERVLDYVSEKHDIDAFDFIVVTHPDKDHYVGIRRLLEKDNYYFLWERLVSELLPCIRNLLEDETIASKIMNPESRGDAIDPEPLVDYLMDIFLAIYQVSDDVKSAVYAMLADAVLGSLEYVCDSIVGTSITSGCSLIEAFDKQSCFFKEFLTLRLYHWLPETNAAGWKHLQGAAGGLTVNSVVFVNTLTEKLPGFRSVCMDAKIFDWVRLDSGDPLVKRQMICWTKDNIGEIIDLGFAEECPLSIAIVAGDGCAGAGKAPVTGDRPENNSSIALLLCWENFLFYTGGDLPQDGEASITRSVAGGEFLPVPSGLPLTGFKCGHHGSDKSTSPVMLEQLTPSFAVISCGEGGTYEHPSDAVAQRLLGCESIKRIYATSCPKKTTGFPDMDEPQLGKPRVMGGSGTAEITYEIQQNTGSGYIESLLESFILPHEENHGGDLFTEASISHETGGVYFTCSYWESMNKKVYPVCDTFLYSGAEGWLIAEPDPEPELMAPAAGQSGASMDIIPGFIKLENFSLTEDYEMERHKIKAAGTVDLDKVRLDALFYVSGTPGKEIWEGTLSPTKEDGSQMGLQDLLAWIGDLFPALKTLQNAPDPHIKLPDLTIGGFSALIDMSKDISEKRLIFLKAFGRLTVCGLEFAVSFQMPRMILQGIMDMKEPPQLTELLALTPIPQEAFKAFPDIRLVAADLFLEIETKAFQVDLELECVKCGIGPFKLKEMQFGLRYAKASGLAGGVKGTVILGEAFELGFGAEYAGKDQGWRFTARHNGTSELSAKAVVDALEKNLGFKDAPQALSSMALTGFYFEYSTGTGDYEFNLDGKMSLGKVEVDAGVVIAAKNGRVQSHDFEVAGTLTLLGMQFQVFFEKADGEDILLASFRNQDHRKISVKDLISAVVGEADIPLDIEVDIEEIKFIHQSKEGAEVTFVQLDMAGDLKLGMEGIPFLSGFLPKDLQAGIAGLSLGYATADISAECSAAWNNILASRSLAPMPGEDLRQGLFAATLLTGVESQSKTLLLQAADKRGDTMTGTQSERTCAKDTLSENDAAGGGSAIAKYFPVEKQIGPAHIHQLGVKMSDGRLWLVPDIVVMVGPVALDLDGAEIGSPLTEFKIKARLNGMGISYSTPAFGLEGDLKSNSDLDPGTVYRYDGQVGMKFSKWMLEAVASYAKMADGSVSFFIFVDATVMLRPHPALTVTQIMGGMGFHNRLLLPEVSEIPYFPLLSLDSGSGALSVLASLAGKNPQGKKWLSPSAGDYWFALGLGFESAEFLTGKGLLAVEFGSGVQCAFMGIADFSLPKGSAPDRAYLHVELSMLAKLNPADGVFQVEASLGEGSFVLSRDCHLTGGAAFFFWFGSSPHKGEFAITVGGYHPAFQPPDYYPRVDRVGIHWVYDSHLEMKGQAYLAVTSSWVMAGADLEIVYSSGDLRAYFTAYANFMAAWHPFAFSAQVGVELGVSYRLNLLFCHKTISVSIGAALELWGPPTGGVVTVHLWFVSFTIAFGAGRDGGDLNKPLGWDRFMEMLPKDKPCSVHGSDGIRATGGDGVWLAKGKGFSFFAETSAPVSHLECGSFKAENKDGIDIRPMDKSGLTSSLSVKISGPGGGEIEPLSQGWSLEETKGNVPNALWGKPLYSNGKFVQSPDVPSAENVLEHMNGCMFTAPAPKMGGEIYIEDLDALSRLKTAKDDAEKSSLYLYDCCIPSLKAGSYKIHVDHYVQDGAQKIPLGSAEQGFQVGETKTVLNSGAVVNQYPLPGSSGAYGHVLPHLVLSDSTFPWEKPLGPQAECPWIALVVLKDSEVLGTRSSDSGQAIQISKDTFKNLMPRLEELPYLVHSRTPEGVEGQVFAVVMANRLPQAAAESQVPYTAHLVSLEGKADLLKEGADLSKYEQIEMESLYSWSFVSSAEDGKDFNSCARRLLKNCEGSTWLEPSAPVAYHKRSGEVVPAVYRGPLQPAKTQDRLPQELMLSSEQVMAYGVTGTSIAAAGASAATAGTSSVTGSEIDCSLAVAWETGRMAALSDKAFVSRMLHIREKIRDTWDVLSQKQSSGFYEGMSVKEMAATPIQQIFGRQISVGMLEKASTATVAEVSVQTVAFGDRSLERLSGRPTQLATQQFFVENEADFADLFQEDLVWLEGWMVSLVRLYPVPFENLICSEDLLKQETVRFFYVDENWIHAMIDGACSIGLDCGRQKAVTQMLKDRFYQEVKKQIPATGVLIRSEMIRFWPNIEMRPYTADRSKLNILRRDFMAPDIVLALFDGEASSIALVQPKESIHMRLNADRTLSPVALNPVRRLDKEIDLSDKGGLVRKEDATVLSLVSGKEDCLTKEICQSTGVKAVSSAAFALQFMEGTESVELTARSS